MRSVTNIRFSDRMELSRRYRFAAEHQFMLWMRIPSRFQPLGPKSPRIGYAAALNQSMPWPEEALITGWFPHLLENKHADRSLEMRSILEWTWPEISTRIGGASTPISCLLASCPNRLRRFGPPDSRSLASGPNRLRRFGPPDSRSLASCPNRLRRFGQPESRTSEPYY